MSRMRIVSILLIFFLYSPISIAQETATVYLPFNENINEVCVIPNSEEGRYHGVMEMKKYEKIIQTNGDIEFYICGELFLYKSKFSFKKCSVSDSPPICKYSDIWELKKIINKKNILYPEEVFKNIFLVERINDTVVQKYKVIWQYYIH